MTIDEIKAEIKLRGMTQRQLADNLHISYSTIHQIMCGAIKLTPQLSAHIDLYFGRQREQVIIYCVDLPEARCTEFVPGWDTLPPAQQSAAIKAVLRHAADRLIALGAEFPADNAES